MARSLESRGGDLSCEPTIERLFFAIFPDPAIAAQIERRTHLTRAKYNLLGHPIGAQRFHITLHLLGDYERHIPPVLIEFAREAAAAVRFEAFPVTFDRALSFGRGARQPYVLTGNRAQGLRSLMRFHRTLGQALRPSDTVRTPARSFTPHLTLLYDRKSIPEHVVHPVSWIVREFALVHSFVGRSHYEILGRWPLLSRDDSDERGAR